MNDKEHLMYEIMGRISASDAPIVFKGAMVTKLILAENSFTAFERQTNDVDANWVGTPPSMDALVGTINSALEEMTEQLYATAFRDYADRKSAGISIRRKGADDELFVMDISMKPVNDDRLYYFGEIVVKGVLANEILFDKIAVMSTRLIFRRAKDMFDVYALAQCVQIDTQEIIKTHQANPNREVGAFDEFYNRQSDLEHAYNKLAGIKNKPPFSDVYTYLTDFIKPFSEKDMKLRTWNNEKRRWDNKAPEKKPAIHDKR